MDLVSVNKSVLKELKKNPVIPNVSEANIKSFKILKVFCGQYYNLRALSAFRICKIDPKMA